MRCSAGANDSVAGKVAKAGKSKSSVVVCGKQVPCEPSAQDDALKEEEVEAAAETNVKDEIEKRLAAKAAWKVRKEKKAAAAAAAGEETSGTRKRALLMVDAQAVGRAVEQAAMLRGADTYAMHRKTACKKLADDRCKVSITITSDARALCWNDQTRRSHPTPPWIFYHSTTAASAFSAAPPDGHGSSPCGWLSAPTGSPKPCHTR